MLKTTSAIVGAAVALYLVGCLGLFLVQRAFIYYPPSQARVEAPSTSTLAVPGAQLLVSERPLPGHKAVLYLGGNAEDVSATLPLLAQAFPRHALYLPHYRGYAGSSGSPSEAALVADALLLFDRIAAVHPDVVVIGRSLGSGVAVQVASRRRAARLVLVTPFDSVQALATQQFPYMPVRWLLRDKYESWKYAPQVRIPTLIVAAGEDEIIPAASTQRLLSHFAPGVASMRVIAGTGHNTIADTPDYVRALQWANE